MRLYHFDGVDGRLDLVPLAARRALDCAGLKLSLEAWRSLPLDARSELVRAGSGARVDAERVARATRGADPAPLPIEPVPDVDSGSVPEGVREAFGPERPIADAVWSALTPLDRYTLAKLSARGRSERIAPAYEEIVGQSANATHLDAAGGARMVGVTAKPATFRSAVAESAVRMGSEAFTRLLRADAPKGDVLGTARLAGIMAAKRTPEIVPLCHPLALTRVDVQLRLDPQASVVQITASVEAFDRTGVEMEALHAASAAALTIYDMLKAFDRGMEIGPTRLLAKSGGRSGDFRR